MKYVRAEGEGVSKKWPIFAYDNTDRLREKRTGGGERVQNPKNFAYVLNGCSHTRKSHFSESDFPESHIYPGSQISR